MRARGCSYVGSSYGKRVSRSSDFLMRSNASFLVEEEFLIIEKRGRKPNTAARYAGTRIESTRHDLNDR